jgi:DNA polymerase epsilon subunit 2
LDIDFFLNSFIIIFLN